MILKQFDMEDFAECSSAVEVYNAMGIGTKEKPRDLNMDNQEVFGKKAYYRNIIINSATEHQIQDIIKKNSKNPEAELFTWYNYAPISSGPKYEIVKERLGEINPNVVYIITPEDDLYEAQRLNEEE